MTTTSLLISALILTSSAIACGSSNSVPSNPLFTCYESSQPEQASACTSCLTGNCGSEVTSLLSACASYLSCLDKCGCETDCSVDCSTTEDCGDAEATLQECEDASCASDCGIFSGGGGGGGAGGQ